MSDVLGSLSVVALIFGGCCSNVFSLEKILNQEPDSGLIITFLQFVLATLVSWQNRRPQHHYAKSKTKPEVPLYRWSVIAAMFFSVNMLNNWAFAFHISVPVHITLRSFGSVWTMLAGYIRGKQYTGMQVLSVALLTVGVVFSAWADEEGKGKDLSAHSETSMPKFVAGLSILLVAQILSAWMGVYVQDTYAAYECTWQANLFWSHALSLPMFLPFTPELKRQYTALQEPGKARYFDFNNSPLTSFLSSTYVNGLSRGQFYLLVNAITQLVCISGVNLLSSRSSAVTVTIVLNVRKLVSFLISTVLFGHTISTKMAIGAALVFGSGGLYGWETSWRIPQRRKRLEAEGKSAGVNGSKHMNGSNGRKISGAGEGKKRQ